MFQQHTTANQRNLVGAALLIAALAFGYYWYTAGPDVPLVEGPAQTEQQ